MGARDIVELSLKLITLASKVVEVGDKVHLAFTKEVVNSLEFMILTTKIEQSIKEDSQNELYLTKQIEDIILLN